MSGKNIVKAGLALIIIVAVILFMFVFVVYLQDAYIKIPVQNSSKVQGRRSVGSVGDYIPFSKRYPCYLCRFINVTAESDHNICW